MIWHRRRPRKVSGLRPPRGVRAVYLDESESPDLAVVYIGVDEGGLDVWEAMLPDSRPIVGLHCDELPGECSIRLWLPGGSVDRA